MILVTGATGHFGNLTIDYLLKTGIPANQISALVRNADKGQDLKTKGINLVFGDYNDYASLVKAFSGVEKLLFVSGNDIPNRLSQHERVVKAAKEAKVEHFIYTSGERKDETPNSPLWLFAKAHFETERLLKESGLTYTILKNGLYMDFIPFFIGDVLKTEMIYLPAGQGKVSFALRSEMAEAAAKVLSSEGHENKVYDFVNTEAYSYDDVAMYISEITGKNINYISPTPEEFTEALSKSDGAIPEDFVGILLAQAQGDGDITSHDLENLIGRKLTSLKSFLQEVYGA
jgi:NAD(P)H dehydrogenase (quinone)